MFRFLFDPKGRVGRSVYLLTAIALHILFALAIWFVISGPMSATPQPLSLRALGHIADHPATSILNLSDAALLPALAAFAVAACACAGFAVLSLNRLRDAKRSLHWMWLALPGSAVLMFVLTLFPSAGSPSDDFRAA